MKTEQETVFESLNKDVKTPLNLIRSSMQKRRKEQIKQAASHRLSISSNPKKAQDEKIKNDTKPPA